MCTCGTDSLPLAVGVTGPAGPTGAAGANGSNGSNGTTILFKYQDSGGAYLSTATLSSFTAIAGAAYTIPADTLSTDGDYLEYKMVLTGGTPSPDFDAVRFFINGTAITNPVGTYVAIATETFHLPYTSSQGAEVMMRITRSSATTATVTLFLLAGNGGSRVDLYSGAFSVNNLTSSNNALTLSLYNAVANSVKIYDIKIIKYSA